MAKGFVVAAPASGSGKTLVTLALLRAFRDAGVAVASAKAGPDYIDPRFHEAASARPCPNLDLWAMGKAGCRALASHAASETELLIVEGVMGLFDGPEAGEGSTADLALALDLPVVLVIDAARQSQSVAALTHGFSTYRPGLNLAGVFLNNVASDRHAAMLTTALNPLGIPVVGQLRRQNDLRLPSRHLGLVQAQENQALEEYISRSAAAVARETNLNKLLTLSAQVLEDSRLQPVLPPLAQRMAIAMDQAFSFNYSHVLAGWRKNGCEIVPFSPLNDEAPDEAAGAVVLPGGYPELYAGKLAAGQTFLKGLRESRSSIYGECGGFMVLGEALTDQAGVRHEMAGLLPFETNFSKARPKLGYRRLNPLNGPWKKPLMGHEFHYSGSTSPVSDAGLFSVMDSGGRDLGVAGARVGNVMGSYMHLICEAP
ncbi:MAG: cobyrinate a,c-diamide synthase [Aestuariivirga sp.]